jgi:hypothetical protein
LSEVIDTTCRIAVDCFCTLMPSLRTSSGSRASAAVTWLRTLIAAWSGSVPRSKLTLIDTTPLDVLVERM